MGFHCSIPGWDFDPYDTLNRLSSLNNSLTGQFGFGYDAVSRRTQLTRPNGVNTNYSYDSLSRLLSVLHQAGNTTLDGASYAYDAAGNRTSKTNQLNSVTEGYTYDPLYQLTQVTQGAATTESYSYDLVGNRLSSVGVPSYQYNASNELTSSSLGSYSYDNNGNTLTDAGGKSYAWDFENRLKQVTLPGQGGTVSFKYDPFGRRIYKSSSSGTNVYLYDGLSGNILDEVDNSGNFVARYTQGSGTDQPLAELRSATTSYYQQDGLGSVSSLSSSTATVASTYIYDAFGKPTASTGTLANPFRYTGREFDSETGVYYYRARYYDQDTGRFLGEDRTRFESGINFYAYVNNQPTIFVDPSGLLAELYCDVIPSSRGRNLWEKSILAFVHPTHCYLRIACRGRDSFYELWGPPKWDPKNGIPAISPFNQDRVNNSTRHPLNPPSGMKCCEFEDRLRDAFRDYEGQVPPYNPLGPNSNTFTQTIIQNAGGTAEFPFGAYGADYNPDLVPHGP